MKNDGDTGLLQAISLRDYFAGQALRRGYPTRQCYHAADELLVCREAPPRQESPDEHTG